MATVGTRLSESFLTDTDLSAYQFFAVTTASTARTVKLANGGSAPIPIGVLHNSPSSGQVAEVHYLGYTKVWADGGTAFINGDLLVSNASGLMVLATGSFSHAIAQQPLATGCAIVEVLWIPNMNNIAHNTP